MKGDKVWYDDVAVLWRHPTEFFPGADQTVEERLNAMVRLVVYASLATFAYNRQPRSLVLGGAAVAIVSLAFRGDGSPGYLGVGDAVKGLIAGPKSGTPTDSSGSGASPGASPGVSAQARRTSACTLPTRDNPFANLLVSDLVTDPNRPAACAYDDVKDQIQDNFNTGLMRDSLDVYQVENSQRQYYTMPVTTGIPDTGAFANFLFPNMKSCKDDQTACIPRTG